MSGRFVQAVKSKICDCSCIIRQSSNIWAGVWPLFKLLSQRYVIVHVLLGRVVTFGQVSGRFVQAVKSKICDCSCIINPRPACAARVTVLGLSFCLSVCLSATLFWQYTQVKV